MATLNPAPRVYTQEEVPRRVVSLPDDDSDDGSVEPIDALEVFDLLRDINDPEHPLTLEQLKVAAPDLISIDEETGVVRVSFTPTIPHCSMATLIGLCVRVKLMRSLPPRYKVDVSVTPGTHASEDALNKQLNDKERVAAALENPRLLEAVEQCLTRS